MTDKQMPFTQAETEYTPVSPLTGESQCANCRFYQYSDTHNKAHCTIVEPWPRLILPTGWCNEWTPAPADVDTEPEIPFEDIEMAYLASNKQTPGIVKRLIGKAKTLTGIIKQDDHGQRIALIVSSNGYKDREEEHVAKSAIGEYAENNGDSPDNRLLFWHDSRLRMGEIIAAQMVDGFLVEVAKEANSPIAKILWDAWEETQADKSVTWGTSIGFRVLERDGDTYTRIQKRETSLLPLEAAANLYTYAGVIKMSNKSRAVDALFAKRGVPNFSEILEKEGLAGVNAALAAAGHTAKEHSHDDEPGVTDEAPVSDAVQDVMLEMVGGYDELASQLEDLRKAYDDREKALSAQTAEIEAMHAEIEAVKALAETVRKDLTEELGRAPRAASESAKTLAPADVVEELEKQNRKKRKIGDLEYYDDKE